MVEWTPGARNELIYRKGMLEKYYFWSRIYERSQMMLAREVNALTKDIKVEN